MLGVLQLAAQLGDVGVDGPADRRRRVAPDFPEKLQTGDSPSLRIEEREQEVQLPRRQWNQPPFAPDGSRRRVDLDPSEALDGDAHLAGLRRATQQPLDPRQQLEKAEGLGDVVVRPEPKAADLVGFLALGGEDEDRKRERSAARS